MVATGCKFGEARNVLYTTVTTENTHAPAAHPSLCFHFPMRIDCMRENVG
jgi:hypothetical protein